jgi:hypothetical protein
MSNIGIADRSAVRELQTVSGVEISITPDLRRRLSALLPPEVIPSEDYLRLSPDKSFCMAEMKRSMQNSLSEIAWPTTQFLWKLHPLFSWLNDKANLTYSRGEAPLIGLSEGLHRGQCLFIIAGVIPNRKSSPVIDEWFALLYQDGGFVKELVMNEVLSLTKLGSGRLPNRNIITPHMEEGAMGLLTSVVEKAKEIMLRHCNNYKSRINPLIDEEIDKLAGLQEKHLFYQLSLFEDERRKTEQERKVERIFNNFVDWVKDTLEIEDNPYIRVIASIMGGE